MERRLCFNRNCVIIVLVMCAIFGITSYDYIKSHPYYIYVKNQIKDIPGLRKSEINILDGCYHVYLDVGSNIGVQVRKLYEPRKYPDAYVHEIFDSYFGPIEDRENEDNPETVCAVGFEPNPHHKKYLERVESSYNKCGWRVKFFTETAVSDTNGGSHFYSDNDKQNLEWGGGILPPSINNIAMHTVPPTNRKSESSKKTSQIKLLRLSDFLINVVGTRKIPSNDSKIPGIMKRPPKIVMKMDIEGSEVDVMPDLIFSGGLQYINAIMIEWHERLEVLPERMMAQEQLETIVETLSEYSETMNNSNIDFHLVNLDDETYYRSKFRLPEC